LDNNLTTFSAARCLDREESRLRLFELRDIACKSTYIISNDFEVLLSAGNGR
jgi:hypothetical protein